MLVIAIILGGLVRFAPLTAVSFPLNDGGMFFSMTKDILSNRFSLPAFTSYNGGQIPFSYPPLPFYLLAILSKLSGISIIKWMQFLPAFISTLTIPAFYLLCRSIIKSQELAGVSSIAFALLPRSFIWLIMGGGISRASGLFFAFLALSAIYLLFSQQDKHFLLPAILWSALVVYSHPEIAWFVCSSAIFFGIIHLKQKKTIFLGIVTALGVIFLTSPWWVTILRQNGFRPWLTAFQVESRDFSTVIRLILFSYTEEPFTQLLGALAILGLITNLVRRKYLLAAWMTIIVLLSFRNEAFLLMMPVAIFAGTAIYEVLIPGFLRFSRAQNIDNDEIGLQKSLNQKPVQILLGILLVYSFISAYGIQFRASAALSSLEPNERQAMAWVAEHSQAEDRYILVTGRTDWEVDSTTEWFPALTGRVSAATVQGKEWLPGYANVITLYHQVQECAQTGIDCIQKLSTNFRFNYVYIRKSAIEPDCCQPLRQSLSQASNYELVYDGPGAMIYRFTGKQ